MTPNTVQRALRIITSPAWKRTKRFPITVLAGMSGLSRQTIYQARAGRGLTKRVVQVLSPILSDILDGKLVATWQAHYSVGVGKGRKEERRFFRLGERDLEWQ